MRLLFAEVVVGVACAMLLVSSCGADYNFPINNRFCGRQLADALSFVCNGQYNYRKRYDIDLDVAGSEESDSLQSLRNLLPADGVNPVTYLVKSAALLRDRRGVHNECCERSCSIRVLLRYCARPTATRRPQHRSSTTQRNDREVVVVAED